MGSKCTTCRLCNNEILITTGYAMSEDPQRFLSASPKHKSFDQQLKEEKVVLIQKAWRKHMKKQNGRKRIKKNYENGTQYVGSWIGENRDGFGEQTLKDGGKYRGEWKNNRAHGKGVFYHTNGDIYEGEWQNDKANGFGIYQSKNGSKYEGYWKNDLQNGKGLESWPDGSFYDGQYVNGLKEGIGKMVQNQIVSFQGNTNGLMAVFMRDSGRRIKQTVMYGIENQFIQGVYRWGDGRVYEGSWMKNMMHGEGHYQWPDGRNYKGSYLLDKKDGFGIYTWSDGRVYEGQWKEGKQNGNGKIIDSEGKVRQGVWEDGKRVSWVKENTIQLKVQQN